jgi:hypothetical protein
MKENSPATIPRIESLNRSSRPKEAQIHLELRHNQSLLTGVLPN